ncbi:right-handed parallel beta-helix repeat-containing protein [Halarchaeum sp. P4]|uniref:right-handed parallel beta-helix repeat-containing protein n=1 Tax=Halarchaeum sp. P4 TaxID=3421639 RepID=UPI003EB96204
MKIPGPRTLSRDEQRRYLKKRDVDPDQFLGGRDAQDTVAELSRDDVADQLPEDVSIDEVESNLPRGIDSIEDLSEADLNDVEAEYREYIEAARPRPEPQSLTLIQRWTWATIGTFYTAAIWLFGLETVNVGYVAHSPWAHVLRVTGDTRGTRAINWASRQINPGGKVYLPAQGPDTNNVWLLDSWITVDRDNVTFEGDGFNRTLLRVADGANVGGFNVGPNGTVRRNITIRDIGYDGNHTNQDQSVTDLDGVKISNGERVTVEESFFTGTSPHHEHSTGGAGISVRGSSDYNTVRNCWFDDNGDRGVEVFSGDASVVGCFFLSGFDRAINFQTNNGSHVIATANVAMDNSQGSIIGVQHNGTTSKTTLTANIGLGDHRTLIHIKDGVNGSGPSGIIAVANIGKTSSSTTSGIHMDTQATDVTVVACLLDGYADRGLRIRGTGFTIGYCIVKNVGLEGIKTTGSDGTISACRLVNTGTDSGSNSDGIWSQSADTTIENCLIDGADAQGIKTTAPGCAVSNNRIKNPNARGLLLRGNDTTARGNIISMASYRPVEVNASDCIVTGTLVMSKDTGSASFYEGDGCDNNLFVANKAPTDESVWRIVGPNTRVLSNFNEFDVHRGLAPSSGSVTVSFAKPYAAKPLLDVVVESEANWSVSYGTDANGNYTSATLSFVDNSGAAVNPTTHVAAGGA